jgi:hypothetical protein
MGDVDFTNLYLDVLSEIDRRVSSGGALMQSSAPADGSQKLAKLEQADFLNLAQTVFEEQNWREVSSLYASLFKPNADRETFFLSL